MNISRAFDSIHFDKVADLSKEEFSRLINMCFEEFLKSNDFKDIVFNCADQALESRR